MARQDGGEVSRTAARQAPQGTEFRVQSWPGRWFLELPPLQIHRWEKRFSAWHELSREPCLWAVGWVTEQGLAWKGHKVADNVPSTGGSKGSRQGLPNSTSTSHAEERARPEEVGSTGEHRRRPEHHNHRRKQAAPAPLQLAALAMRGGGLVF